MTVATKLKTVEDALNELDEKGTERIAGVHRKLSIARQRFHAIKLKKSGKNTFAGYDYFELGDFLVPALGVFDEVGLGATVSFGTDLATMTICDLDNPADTIEITSPMGSAALKGCHEVQNIGAVETYQRRYLWIAALEIVEHDALDKVTGKKGSEPDYKPDTRLSAAITQTQEDDLRALISEVGADEKRFCQYIKVNDLSELPAREYDNAVKALNAKKGNGK